MRKINYLAFLLSGLLSAQTTFTLVKDIYPGATGSGPSNFTLYKGKLYFLPVLVSMVLPLGLNFGRVTERKPAPSWFLIIFLVLLPLHQVVYLHLMIKFISVEPIL
jgi:hypothetical protein